MIRELEELKKLWERARRANCFGDTRIVITSERASLIVCGDTMAWKKIETMHGVSEIIKELLARAKAKLETKLEHKLER